jgi:myo-inositol-1(or 4)-monophosphatase
MSRELDTAIRAAREAGRILVSGFNKIHRIEMKGKRDFLTEMDLKSEKRILSILGKHFPGYSMYSEERGKEIKESDFMWVVDPLDGTKNYSIQNPFFNVSIALLRKGEPIAGVVYAPFTDEMFCAESGEGSYLNGREIRVSDESDISRLLLAYCHNHDKRNTERLIEAFRRIKPLPLDFNRMRSGALELAFVAAGRLGCYLGCGFQLYDVAAGALLVREAGGKVTDFDGREFDSGSNDILASNGGIHDKILELLKGI